MHPTRQTDRLLVLRARATATLLVGAFLSIAALPAAAQKEPTRPEAAAKAMFDRRVPAADAARTLVDQYRQSSTDVVGLLAVVGYAHRDVAATSVGTLRMTPDQAARALHGARVDAPTVTAALAGNRVATDVMGRALHGAGYSAVESSRAVMGAPRLDATRTYEVLKVAGYTHRQLHEAVTELGMPIALDCIGPDGYPAPCGNFGNGTNTPAMGQVTLSPAGSGETGGVVVFESTNIPPVDVLLGGQELSVLEMTPSRVRAHLPNYATSGVLAFRRQSDGVIGVIADAYSVVEAPPDPVASVDWSAAADVAYDGALLDADAWIMGSRFDASYCKVSAISAVATPGVLSNSGGFQGNVRSGLLAAGVPDEVASAWQNAFEDALLEWADGVTVPGLPWYPAFAAYPGPEAPPMPNIPTPLITLMSAGTAGMTPMGLTAALNDALPGAGAAGREGAIASFANELGATFALFAATAQVMNVLGSGPVPSFAPPAVPVGPVVMGSCESPGMWATSLPSGSTVNLPNLND